LAQVSCHAVQISHLELRQDDEDFPCFWRGIRLD